MAKSNTRGAGPGTYSSGGVRCTMDAPFSKGSNKGSSNGMGAPFNAPRAGGDNNLPTTVYDTSLKGAGKSTPASKRDVPGTIATNPKANRRSY